MKYIYTSLVLFSLTFSINVNANNTDKAENDVKRIYCLRGYCFGDEYLHKDNNKYNLKDTTTERMQHIVDNGEGKTKNCPEIRFYRGEKSSLKFSTDVFSITTLKTKDKREIVAYLSTQRITKLKGDTKEARANNIKKIADGYIEKYGKPYDYTLKDEAYFEKNYGKEKMKDFERDSIIIKYSGNKYHFRKVALNPNFRGRDQDEYSLSVVNEIGRQISRDNLVAYTLKNCAVASNDSLVE